MTDLTLETRQSIIPHLKSFAPLTALIPASSIYGEYTRADVTWPFIRYGSSTLPWDPTCYDGSEILVDLHVFANGPSTDAVARAAKQVVEAMKVWDGGDATWIGNVGPLADNPEASKWHVVCQFRVFTVGT